MRRVSFPDFMAFSADAFWKSGAFFYPVRSYGQAGPVLHLCQLVYSLPLHNFRDGISCGRNLGLCRIQPLIEAEEDTLSYSQDLLFLLSPQPWETMTSTLAQHVGEQFALLRQSKELTVQEMAERAGLSPRKIKGVEFDIIDTYTTPFQSYLQCAKYLGASLHNIFDAVLERRRFHGLPQTDQIQRAEQRQQVILEKNAIQDKVSEMIKQLEHSGKPVTYQSISTLISAASVSSSENWQVIRFINQYISQYLYAQHNIVQEEDTLVVRTEIAINQLKELGAVLTRRAIAAIVGRYQEDLQQYPSIEVLWKDFPET
jgi:transcriptional regulator with XRE-family HTH domain